MRSRFRNISGMSLATLMGILGLIITVVDVRACPEDNSWCSTVDGVCDSESTKHLCPRTCKTCLPDICGECAQNCTTFDEGREFRCTCNAGYQLDTDGVSCSDINECEVDPNICGGDRICRNTDGKYDCVTDECKKFYNRHYVRSYSYPEQCCKMTKGSCGQNSQNLNTVAKRIYGGQNSTAGMWPWHAIIETPTGVCGGALISDLWVITAAQCFGSTANIKAKKLRVIFGVLDQNERNSHTKQVRRIVQVIKHSRFKFPLHDIAAVKLDRAIEESDFVRPVCLPNGEVPEDGTRCFATGFGITSEGAHKPAQVLQQVDLQIVDTTSCRDAYQNTKTTVGVRSMICAGNSKKNICQGDNGGPLVCQRCNSCDWFLAGISSFGSQCGASDRPGVFTNIEFYEKMISRWTRTTVKVIKKTCKPIQWSQWGGWTRCSKSCGYGFQSRIRRCSDRSGTGLPGCLGNYFDRQPCNTVSCDIGPWGEWTECSKSCGVGEQTRTTGCKRAGCERLSERRDCNKEKCPEWNRWTQWSVCSKTCGSGSRTRRRTCDTGKITDCNGQSSTMEACNEAQCPSWGDWSRWSRCSEDCGGGTQVSTRECIGGHSGVDCRGSDDRSRKCNTHRCEFSKWSEWTSCSTTCGTGTRERQRSCPKTSCKPDRFGSSTKDSEACNENPCSGTWTKWTGWSPCNVTCGGGRAFRLRICNDGPKCPGKSQESRSCSRNPCPTWSDWSSWSECDATCGLAKMTRTRSCQHGSDCVGKANEFAECLFIACPTWSKWSSWSPCDVTCGVGLTERNRTCENGPGCNGEAEQRRMCNRNPCPTWSDWSDWSPCSVTCGTGTQERDRSCSNGDRCLGHSRETTECTAEPCPSWSNWSSWSSCGVTCGEGFSKRKRSCENGPGCNGEAEQRKLCIEDPCPTWSDWSDWSTCSASCGEGNHERTRSCQHGDSCPGASQQTDSCQLKVCPSWSKWSEWSQCSETCGGGFETRNRTCENAANGDDECVGDNQETQPCATELCPSECDYICIARVHAGGCFFYRDWMSRSCHPDCCGPAQCHDELTEAECANVVASQACAQSQWFVQCLASCGACPGNI